MKIDAIIGMEVTLQVGCPNMCLYCPQEVLLTVYPKDAPRRFTLASFQHCLRTVPTTRHLTFMGAVEPYVNPEATAIMLWAHERGHEISLSTTLRGATRADVDAVANLARMTDVIIHVPADDGRMHLPVTDEWLAMFEYAIAKWRHYSEFVISVYGQAHPKVLPIWQRSGIPIVNLGYHDRAGLLKGRGLHFVAGEGRKNGPLPLCGKQFCGHLFPNGDVCRCCNDYAMTNVWGNLNPADRT